MRERRISLVDGLPLVLAKDTEGGLLTGDAALRALAETEGVHCHGLLWLFDCFEEEQILNAEELYAELDGISAVYRRTKWRCASSPTMSAEARVDPSAARGHPGGRAHPRRSASRETSRFA